MKQLALPISILALVLTIGSFFYNSSSSEQVYVDVNKLLEGYDRTKIVRTEFEEKGIKQKSWGID